MERYLGLDVGEKRIGIAVSDLLGITAQGVETMTRKELSADLSYLIGLIETYEVAGVVVGLPKNMNNTLGFKAQEVQEFIHALTEQKDIPIYWMDERLTTMQAHQVLLEADMSRKKRKKVVDKMAAVFILQTWLDMKR